MASSASSSGSRSRRGLPGGGGGRLERVNPSAYYATYHGHLTEHLAVAHDCLRRRHGGIIFLAGDSSLDNKVWFGDEVPAINGYEEFLSPPVMKADVCYWINHQDRFIGEHITDQDYLVVSIGGNDIALKPVLCTIVNLLLLVRCTPLSCLENLACGCPPNLCLDDGCFCCGLPGCMVGLLGCPPGVGYFINMFRNTIQNYILKILGCKRPRKVLVCMIYYPDERASGGWADHALSFLSYDADPERLQTMIRTVFRVAISRICIPGTEVVAVPLFEALDGKTTGDYIERVEPSVAGGRKMASLLVDSIVDSSELDSEQELTSDPKQQQMM